MKVPRPSEEAKEAFRSIVPDAPGVEIKAMFANLGAFVNGNMFAGLFGDDLGVKVLDEDARAELAAIPGVGPFGPEERPMGGYLALPADWSERPEFTATWLAAALGDVGALPPKQPKPGKQSKQRDGS